MEAQEADNNILTKNQLLFKLLGETLNQRLLSLKASSIQNLNESDFISFKFPQKLLKKFENQKFLVENFSFPLKLKFLNNLKPKFSAVHNI